MKKNENTPSNRFYIDTRPGVGSLFSPGTEVDNYAAWLEESHKKGFVGKGGQALHFGVSQQINAILYQAKSKVMKINVFVIGPHKQAVIDYLVGSGVPAELIEVVDS